MSLFGRIIGAMRAPASPSVTSARAGFPNSSTTLADLEELAGWIAHGAETHSGELVTPDRALTLSSVYRAVALVSGVTATTPIGIRRRAGDLVVAVPDHPVARLLARRPNRWQKRGPFVRMMNSHLMLRGNAYAMKIRDARRNVVELIPMHPDRVEPIQAPDFSIAYRYTRPDGRVVTLPQSEVFHVLILTLDGVKGVSPMHFAREAIGAGLGLEKHGASVFKNRTAVGSVIEVEKTLSDQAIEHLKASLEAFRGAENAHKNLILEEGAQFKPIGMTLADAEFIANRKFSRTDIAMFFGVPPHMLGDDEKSDGSGRNLEERSRAFVAYTLEDYFSAWEDAINADLLDGDESLFAQVQRSALIRGDIATRAKWYQTALQWGIMSPDEIRAEEGLNPRPDGKGGEFYPPPNMSAKDTTADAAPEGDNPEVKE